MSTRIVSFYTPDYAREAELLKASMERCGVPTADVVPVEDAGDWYDNTRRKAWWVRDALARSNPVLWVDSDAYLHADPRPYFDKLAAEGFDFAAHWFQGPSGGYDSGRNDDRMLSGTAWFNATSGGRALAALWAHTNDTLDGFGMRDGGGQKNLWMVATALEMAGRINVARLPGRYCYVFDKPWAYPADEPRVIEHLIASRENRGPSKGKTNEARQARIAELRREVGLDP